MNHVSASWILLGLACLPFIYYILVLYSSWQFFRRRSQQSSITASFTPPVSILKPVRGVDPDAYENFASFCRQDYPEFEIVFCVGSVDDPILPVVENLQKEFPDRHIRILFGSGRIATNDKVAKLARLSSEARYEHLVINDSDVRVSPDYLRAVVAPLKDPKVGAVTCMYVSTGDSTRVNQLQTIGMISDFYPGLLVARQLDGVKFALGPTIATKRSRLAEFGGYEKIENLPADDLLVGRLISEAGYEIQLSPHIIESVPDYGSFRELVHKRMRWLVVMRHMRPWGHFGLLFAQAFPWVLGAILVDQTWSTAASLLGAYFMLRMTIIWSVGIWGLQRRGLWQLMPFVVLWDALAFAMWVTSFARNTIRWRGGDYYIRDGMLVPAE